MKEREAGCAPEERLPVARDLQPQLKRSVGSKDGDASLVVQNRSLCAFSYLGGWPPPRSLASLQSDFLLVSVEGDAMNIEEKETAESYKRTITAAETGQPDHQGQSVLFRATTCATSLGPQPIIRAPKRAQEANWL